MEILQKEGKDTGKRRLWQTSEVGKFRSINYIEYENNGDRNETLLIEKYLYKIRIHFKDIINDLNNLIRGKFN